MKYGKSVIKKLSKKLVSEYGRGYGEGNIFRMLKFYDYFQDFEILSTLSTKLSWSHFVELLQIPEKLKRDFYATMCSNEFWGVRTLRERICSSLFERTAISNKPEQTIINDLQLLSKENNYCYCTNSNISELLNKSICASMLFLIVMLFISK